MELMAEPGPDPSLLWKVQVLSGVAGLVLGGIAMVWPLETAAAVVVLWGFFVLVDGVGLAYVASRPGTRGRGLLLVAAGITALVAVLVMFRPGVAVTSAVWLVGLWLVARGLLESLDALRRASGSARWLLLAGAALTCALGGLFLWNPGGSVVALAFLLGLLAALRGLALVVAALPTRQLARGTQVGPALA
jgi:uncharacterized membrane protein HdeD (DUF308 family)